MTRDANDRLARTWVVIANAVGLALALMLPLLITTAVGTPGGTGATLVALVATVVIAFGSRLATFAAPADTLRVFRSVDPGVGPIGEVNDPPHHPIRPRAPGLA